MNQNVLPGQPPPQIPVAPPLPRPPPQQPQRPPQLPPNPPRVPLHPLYVRAPPRFKSGSDFELYLQRFSAYARAANCPDEEKADLLISLLDDKALSSLYRLLEEGDYEMDDVIAQLRRAEGYNQSSERYVAELLLFHGRINLNASGTS